MITLLSRELSLKNPSPVSQAWRDGDFLAPLMSHIGKERKEVDDLMLFLRWPSAHLVCHRDWRGRIFKSHSCLCSEFKAKPETPQGSDQCSGHTQVKMSLQLWAVKMRYKEFFRIPSFAVTPSTPLSESCFSTGWNPHPSLCLTKKQPNTPVFKRTLKLSWSYQHFWKSGKGNQLSFTGWDTP